MQVTIKRHPMRFGYAVYVWEEGPHTGNPLLKQIDPEGRESWVEVPVNVAGDLSPTYSMGEEELEALLDAAQGVVPQSAGLQAHLKDAREMRDRLLGMVEDTHTAFTRPMIRGEG